MRGSVYYQSALLAKQIFESGAKKENRIDPNHPHFQKVASFQTMESYRNIWNNFFNYLKEHWCIKDAEKISSEHITAYLDYKIEYYPSKLYLQKIVSALGKLEVALQLFGKNIYNETRHYDFSIRQYILDEARNLDLVADNYHHRAYNNPELLIASLSDPAHQLAARIQYEGGARIEGVALIKAEQLQGTVFDSITNQEKAFYISKEKGGKCGPVSINCETYNLLMEYIKRHRHFKINRQHYWNDLKQAAILCKENTESSHGLRWNFAKRRMFEYAQAGHSYLDSLKQVSNEMKHNRASITEHYLGG
ncbi:MAG: hypothetical protein PHO27_05110 [Sulfuricurvum sp.]|nr:hypothetical protein [Sulfuricurvum sp.]